LTSPLDFGLLSFAFIHCFIDGRSGLIPTGEIRPSLGGSLGNRPINENVAVSASSVPTAEIDFVAIV
jgi:hypothetical protein